MPRLIHRPESLSAPVVTTPDADRVSGVVTYHNVDKAYGKIHALGVEYFFHITSCPLTFARLIEGTLVTFTCALTEKGPRAFDVCQNHHPQPEETDAAETRGNR